MKVKSIVTERRNFDIGSEFVTKSFKNCEVSIVNFVAVMGTTSGY